MFTYADTYGQQAWTPVFVCPDCGEPVTIVPGSPGDMLHGEQLVNGTYDHYRMATLVPCGHTLKKYLNRPPELLMFRGVV